jgi:hypothetical protein
MLPVVEEIGNQFETIKDHLANRRYRSGSRLISDMFKGLQKSYDMAPDVFRIIQLFQQTGLVQELNPQIRSALNGKGAFNFKTARKIIEEGIEQNLIKETNPFEYVDVLWGMFVEIIQLEDIKSQPMLEKRFLRPTLKLEEQILISAMARKLTNDH